jgi:hypothetical protein
LESATIASRRKRMGGQAGPFSLLTRPGARNSHGRDDYGGEERRPAEPGPELFQREGVQLEGDVPLHCAETGQPFLASSAGGWSCLLDTRYGAAHHQFHAVILIPPPASMVMRQLVDLWRGASLLIRRQRYMRQAAWAAAISSSGLVPAAPLLGGKEKAQALIPLKFPLPN